MTRPELQPEAKETAAPAVALTGVAYSYSHTPALQGVSISAAVGEVIAVTGSSGCGKSTLLHVAAGLLSPQAGRVELFGHDLAKRDEADRALLRRRVVGIILQYGQLVPDMSIEENVALPLLLDGRARADAFRAAQHWVEKVGLRAVRTATPAEISGGQAQRAAIARALVTTPRLVFADEPVASLDTRGGEEMLALLVDQVRTNRATLILVTHDNVVAARADREVRLRDGRVDFEVNL
jgi:putative ABC transport system ATP-binding protein